MTSERQILIGHGLTKHYGNKKALDGVDIVICRGETLGIFGPNGSGKSTLARILSGITSPDSGAIKIFGQENKVLLRKNVLLIYQSTLFNHSDRVWDALVFWAKIHGIRDYKYRIEEALRLLKLHDKKRSRISQLSTGQQKKVELAKLFIKDDASIVILDEPFANLDVASVSIVKERMRELVNEEKSLVIISHCLDDIMEFADRILLLSNGRKIREYTRDELQGEIRRSSTAWLLELTLRGLSIKEVKSLEEIEDVEKVDVSIDRLVSRILERLGVSGGSVKVIQLSASEADEFLEKIKANNVSVLSLSREEIQLDTKIYLLSLNPLSTILKRIFEKGGEIKYINIRPKETLIFEKLLGRGE